VVLFANQGEKVCLKDEKSEENGAKYKKRGTVLRNLWGKKEEENIRGGQAERNG